MSHYSLAQKPKQLLKWAENIAIDIYLREIQYPVLVYRGMSGISAATALSLQLHILGIDHGMVYVRKDEEQSHGRLIEREPFNNDYDPTFIFVDDFVSSGATKLDCIRKISNCGWWPDLKTQFDYCAVQERDTNSGRTVYATQLVQQDGNTLCKN